MNKKSIFLIAASPLAILAGCGGKQPDQAAIRVELSEVTAVSGRAASYYSGTIEAQKSIPLSFMTLGTVEVVTVREGQQVQKGELLAKLDCQSNENALRMAEAKAKQADDAFRRFEPMYKNGNLPEIKMVEIETARTEAGLSLKMAAKNAADCTITAPENGLISERAAEPGSSVIPGKAALRLVTVDQVYAAIAVPEGEISGIKSGMRAEVEISALQNNRDTGTSDSGSITLPLSRQTLAHGGKFRGVVTDSGVSPNPLARTYNVRVLVNNPGRKILPGMICNVYISSPGLSKLTLVPATAVSMDEGGQAFVYVVGAADKTARRRLVQTAGFAKGGILISRGLAEGETVVSIGVQKLTDGARITAEQI